MYICTVYSFVYQLTGTWVNWPMNPWTFNAPPSTPPCPCAVPPTHRPPTSHSHVGLIWSHIISVLQFCNMCLCFRIVYFLISMAGWLGVYVGHDWWVDVVGGMGWWLGCFQRVWNIQCVTTSSYHQVWLKSYYFNILNEHDWTTKFESTSLYHKVWITQC